jgi:hypothetical protein
MRLSDLENCYALSLSENIPEDNFSFPGLLFRDGGPYCHGA